LLQIAAGAIIVSLFNLAERGKPMTTPNVKLFNRLALLGLMMLSIAFAAGCATEPETNSTTPTAATPTPATAATPAGRMAGRRPERSLMRRTSRANSATAMAGALA